MNDDRLATFDARLRALEAREGDASSGPSVGGALEPRQALEGPMLFPGPVGFWARLTSQKVAKGGYYSWERLTCDASTAVVPAESGTDNAKEVNAVEDLYVDATTGTVVWLEQDGTNDPAEYRFVILPKATTQYQVLAANAADLICKPDWVRAH